MIDLSSAWMMKAIGAISGTAMALLFIRPKGIYDVLVRGTFTTMSGWFFSDRTATLLGFENVMTAAVFVSLFAWPVFGFLLNLLTKLDVDSILKILTYFRKK